MTTPAPPFPTRSSRHHQGHPPTAGAATQAQASAPLDSQTPKRAPSRTRAAGNQVWQRILTRVASLLPTGNAAGWLITALVTLLAAVLRLPGLNRATTLMFDETYYVKDAYSLAHLGYEGSWAENSDSAFVSGNFSGLSPDASFVVHPPTGKWLIALGEAIFGWNNPVGWRIMAVLFGILGVFLLCRIAWNLFRSPALTALAGVFMATDGIAIVLSRIGILDVFIATVVEAAFLAVIKDQIQTRPLLEGRLRQWMASSPSPDQRVGHGGPADPKDLGPSCGRRWWLLVAGVLLGVACSIKWNGVYPLAFLGLFVALRDWTVRRQMRHPRALRAGLVMDTSVAFWAMVPTAIVVYVASWWGWFAHPKAWGRTSGTGLFDALKDFWAYHRQMWDFHTGLSDEHPYAAKAVTWLLQLRPTSFFWEKEGGTCGGEDCVRDVVALGNPLLWWIGILALVVAIVLLVRTRDWRVGVILLGYLAMYVPWLAYPERTVFTFYTVVFVPFVALVVAWMIAVLLGRVRVEFVPMGRLARAALGVFRPGVRAGTGTLGRDAHAESPTRHQAHAGMAPASRRLRIGLAVLGAALAVVIILSAAYFYTVWTGVLIPYNEWYSRMWLESWI